MLSTVSPITSLTSSIVEQLQKIDDFYVCTRFTKGMIGPAMIYIGDEVYFRFMKFIYLPQPPEELNTEQVIKVCDLRLNYLDQLVDVKFNSYAMKIMADCIRSTLPSMSSRLKALDFGCGSGLSSELLLKYLPNLDIRGIDVSKKAIRYCQEQGLSAIHLSSGEKFPFERASFDLIFAAFVLQFNISVQTLAELASILRPTGKFLFNTYQRCIDTIVQQLHAVGFDSIEVWNNVYGNGVKYAIVSCGIPTL